jgi:uncharacterized membrane protein
MERRLGGLTAEVCGTGAGKRVCCFIPTKNGMFCQFVVPFILFRFSPRQNSHAIRNPATTLMKKIKVVSKLVLAGFLVFAGSMHFARPEFFLKIMPPYLPLHRELVLLSGVFEILLGISLLVSRLTRVAAWGIIALLLAVFPANIFLFQHQEILPAPPLVHLLRLPMQAVFILWAYWHTRPDHEKLNAAH